MLDLVVIGDLMIDFTYLGESDSGMMLFERNPGGAPMNVAAQLARLGGRAAAVASVGNDEHGEFLRRVLANQGVDVSNISTCPEQGTRMLFVYFREGTERYFSDYRGSRADLALRLEDIDYSLVERTRALLYSPLCNVYDKPIYEATRQALAIARRKCVPLAFDANFRFPYANEKLRQLDIEAIISANIVKMTQEEFVHYLDEKDVVRGGERLLKGNAKLVAISMGADGCIVGNKNGFAQRPAFSVPSVDTTGAGDSFMGALLYRATRPGIDLDTLSVEDLGGIAEFANACAAASTTRRGSLMVMPDMEEALRILNIAPIRPLKCRYGESVASQAIR